MNKKKDDIGPRLSFAELEKFRAESRNAAMTKALQGEKVRYKSSSDPEKFKAFLEKRLELWDSLKSNVVDNGRLKKGFTNRYFEKMYEKTKEIIENLPC
jgi:hypothetical protein